MSSPGMEIDNEERKSLYDIEKSRLGEKVIVVHRIIFIGCLKKETEKRLYVAAKIQEDIANMRDKDDENLSGLMLMYTRHFIQILECSEKVFVSVARYLSSKSSSNLVQKAKIISISHDITQRIFKVVHTSALDIMAQNLHNYQPTESVEKLVVDTVGHILELGARIVKLPKPEIAKCLENLHTDHSDLLPQQAVLNYMLKEDDGSLITMEEFLSLHDLPYDFTFDSELVWPLEARLYPNNYMT